MFIDGSGLVFIKNIVLLIFQIVCRVYTCFEGTCNTVKCPTDSLPYKPGVKVCSSNSWYTLIVNVWSNMISVNSQHCSL